MEEQFLQIKAACLAADTTDPIALAEHIMQQEFIRIHGPEHHVLDGACLLAALHNAGMEFDLPSALDEMIQRGQKMPGATCGQWGMCGSAASVGAALSIVHGSGPLSGDQFYKDNLLCVSQVLGRIAAIGGPRCCKRNAFLALRTAAQFVRQQYGVSLEQHPVVCDFSPRNRECIGHRCPFYPGTRAGE